MIEMIRRFVRQKYGSAGLVAALAILSILQILQLASDGARNGFALANWAVFVLAAGSVSRDISSGAIQMILARPIRRTRYLFGRYLGILAAFGLFLGVTSLLSILAINVIPSGAAELPPGRLAAAAGGAFFSGGFQAAILLFFSTFLPGIADLLGLLVLYLVLNLPFWNESFVWSLVKAARENLLPTVPWNDVLQGQGVLGAATGRWVLALTAYLAAAAVVFSRRELPYGQD